MAPQSENKQEAWAAAPEQQLAEDLGQQAEPQPESQPEPQSEQGTARRPEALPGRKDKQHEGPQSKAAAKRKKPKKGSAAWKRKREQNIQKALRLLIQIAFFVLAPGLFSSALNGVKYLCTQIGAIQAIEPTSFVVVLVGAVAYTVLFGRFFCGYACAFGTMGDILFLLFTPVRKLLHIPALQEHPRLLSCLQFLKLGVLLAVCALCFTGFWDAVSAYSPWTVFGKVTSGAGWEGVAKKGVAVLVAIMLIQALFERSFCRFLCPMGGLFSLLPVLPFSLFNRRRESCAKSCNRCQDACPVDIHPDQGGFHAGECIACGRCAMACPLHNVNLVFVPMPLDGEEDAAVDDAAGIQAAAKGQLATQPAEHGPAGAASALGAAVSGSGIKPAPKPKRPGSEPALLKWRGSGAATVLFKAGVLLCVCWLVGLMRFAPSPNEVLPFTLPWM